MWFEKMGIYGMEKIENIILAGIAIGDPVLLIGSHGTAKTTLCRKLAESLNMKFHAYDASKALFEDIIGFPNPDTISKGQVEYVPTALSIWDKEFVLIDEISRARAESQNKWLEIIRSRKVMGLPVKNLKIVFAAMNPPSYLGANPLDEALAGRFTFIVKVPSVDELNDVDVRKIINNVNEDDGKCLSGYSEKKLTEEEQKEFSDFILEVRNNIKLLDKTLNGRIDDYLTKFMRIASTKDLKIDGRRLNMAKRNILAYISVLYCQKEITEFKFDNLREHIFYSMKYTLPFEAIDMEVSNMKIKFLHDFTFDFIDKKTIDGVFEIKSVEDVNKINNDLINQNYFIIKSAITKIIEKVKSKNNIEEKPLYVEILKRLVKRIHNGEIKLENNDIERIFETYDYLFDMSCRNNYYYSGLHFFGEYLLSGIIENAPDDIFAFKLLYNLLREKDRDDIDKEKFKLYLKIYKNYSDFRGEQNEN